MGNDSAAKMDETALGPWVSVVRKRDNNRKDPFKKSKKVFLGRVPQTASLTLANASSPKSSLRHGCSDSLFQNECRQDPKFLQQVSALERMLRVKTRKEEASVGAAATAGVNAGIGGLREVHKPDGLEGANLAGVGATELARLSTGNSGSLLLPEAGGAVTAGVPAFESDLPKHDNAGTIGSLLTPEARVAALEKSESDFSKNLAERSDAIGCLSQTDFPSLSASGCVASVCARLPAAAPASSFAPASRVSSPAVFAVGSHARSTPMHDARNSCSNTAINSLRDQRCRRVRSSRTVGIRFVVQTVDMSPAPVAGTYRRSADKVHDQRQVSRKRRAESSGVDPGPGPGGRSGQGGGVSGLAAACLEIPCSLVMPPGRHQFAPQSLGCARVCGSLGAKG